ncbi:hypothetical protein LIER_17706 [Lithospermum erythrorhizon]|uniref:Uncharacterized protein n=1 Tax=Lithospermum erythrorhizon TaxID=34254 RepID=A0AAV3QB90_LITER
MTPIQTTTTITTMKGVTLHSPMSYLFGSMSTILIIIVVALLILACFYRKSSSSQSYTNDHFDEEKPAEKPVYILQPEMEPRVVVIMAGDLKPTCLGTPASVIANCDHDDEQV